MSVAELIEVGYLCADCGATLEDPTGFPTVCEGCQGSPDEPRVIVVGIDTGASGAVAHGPPGEPPEVFDLAPERVVSRGSKTYNVASVERLAEVLRGYQAEGARVLVFVELPIPMGKNGSVAAVQTGRTLGRLEGVALAHGAEVCPIDPEEWKRTHGLKGGGDYDARKEDSIALAEQLYPHLELRPAVRYRRDGRPYAKPLSPITYSDRAEAALIWAHGCAVS